MFFSAFFASPQQGGPVLEAKRNNPAAHCIEMRNRAKIVEKKRRKKKFGCVCARV